MKITHLQQLVAADFTKVNNLISHILDLCPKLAQTAGKYILCSGGKRLRPLLTLLAAKACDCHNPSYIQMAAVVELIHVATLLHDDVIDISPMRRGNQTVQQIWGTQTSIIIGDFLYSKAFQLMVDGNNMQIMRLLSNITNLIAEGEIIQLQQAGNLAITASQYKQIINYKTAQLFSAAAQIPAILSNQNTLLQPLAKFGLHFGMAYQLLDDIADYQGSTGKQSGDDIAEGKITMPLIHLLKRGTIQDRQLVKAAIKKHDRSMLELICQAINKNGGFTYTNHLAEKHLAIAKNYIKYLPNTFQLAKLADSLATKIKNRKPGDVLLSHS